MDGGRTAARAGRSIGARTASVLVILLALIALSDSARATASTEPVSDTVELVVFHGDGCPHCAAMLAFLDDLQERHDSSSS